VVQVDPAKAHEAADAEVRRSYHSRDLIQRDKRDEAEHDLACRHNGAFRALRPRVYRQPENCPTSLTKGTLSLTLTEVACNIRIQAGGHLP